jgi:exonuclease VII small subunit
MTNLNLWLLDPEDLVKYYHPKTETEEILYAALQDAVKEQFREESNKEALLNALEDRVSELEDEKDNLETQLDQYKEFFNYISAAYEKIDGTWPKCEIDNDNWTQAIYDHIANNPLKTDES